MNLSDVLSVIAIILGPSIGIYLSHRLANAKSRLKLFRELQIKRVSFPADIGFVHVMNSIIYEFPKDKELRELWEDFLNHVKKDTDKMDETEFKLWSGELDTKIENILEHIAKKLKIGFRRLEITKGTWQPGIFQTILQNQKNLTDILAGNKAIKIEQISIYDRDKQMQLAEAFSSIMKGEKPIKIEIVTKDSKK